MLIKFEFLKNKKIGQIFQNFEKITFLMFKNKNKKVTSS